MQATQFFGKRFDGPRILLLICLLAIGAVITFVLCRGPQNRPCARLQVISQTPTNGGHVVHFRLVPTGKSHYFAVPSHRFAYDRQLSLQLTLDCSGNLGGLYNGPKDFEVFFPTNYPIWRLEFEVSADSGVFRNLKWYSGFVVERLRGFGWLPTPPQFFGLLESYNSFLPDRSTKILSGPVYMPSSESMPSSNVGPGPPN